MFKKRRQDKDELGFRIQVLLMDSKVAERDSKRQKLEEDEKLEENEMVEDDEKLEEVSSPSTEEWDDEDVRLFEEEHKRSGVMIQFLSSLPFFFFFLT